MNLEQYHHYQLEDFLEDKGFRNWVYAPNQELDVFWEKVLAQYPEQTQNTEQARTLLLAFKQQAEAAQGKSTVDENFATTLQQTLQASAQQSEHRVRRLNIIHRWSVAAAIFLAIVVLSWLWFKPSAQNLVYQTAYGEWKTVNLPDGSVVKLNANSELRLSANWQEGADRKVWLKGEAFFKVQKKPSTGAKFRVQTKDLTVEVLGTSFNVQSRAIDTKVFLEEGKIRLDLGKKEELLQPGEFITYSRQKQTLVKAAEQPREKYTSWKEGVLILEQEPTATILQKIEEIYGVEMVVQDDSLLAQIKTVRVPMDELNIAIPILEQTLGVRITQQGKQLILE